MENQLRKYLPFLIAIFCLCLTGCMGTGPSFKQDPLFYYNRTMFYINQDIDRTIIRPITKTYTTLMPGWIQDRIHLVFSNVDDINVIVNDLLQFDLRDAWQNSCRFLINSTLGLAGLFDVAVHYDFPKHYNDFGLTLARWGYYNSKFIVIPLLGPSTTRDSFGIFVDYSLLSVWPYIKPSNRRQQLLTGYAINKRRHLLSKDTLIREAFDPFVFVRDAYMKSRKKDIKDRLRAVGKRPKAESESAAPPPN